MGISFRKACFSYCKAPVYVKRMQDDLSQAYLKSYVQKLREIIFRLIIANGGFRNDITLQFNSSSL